MILYLSEQQSEILVVTVGGLYLWPKSQSTCGQYLEGIGCVLSFSVSTISLPVAQQLLQTYYELKWYLE